MIQIDKNKQRIFNKVAKHLMRQKTRSQDKGGICMYRYGELMCAAGVLIPDEKYLPEMEGMGWRSMVQKRFVSRVNEEFIEELQILHDSASLPYWRDELIELAIDHKLNYKFLEI